MACECDCVFSSKTDTGVILFPEEIPRTPMVCEHLAALEKVLLESGEKETFRGKAWTENCREWVYFDVILDTEELTRRFTFAPCVMIHENTNPRSGLERGFACTTCFDGTMGMISGPYKKFP